MAGKYNEEIWESLDFVLDEASKRNLSLIIPIEVLFLECGCPVSHICYQLHVPTGARTALQLDASDQVLQHDCYCIADCMAVHVQATTVMLIAHGACQNAELLNLERQQQLQYHAYVLSGSAASLVIP